MSSQWALARTARPPRVAPRLSQRAANQRLALRERQRRGAGAEVASISQDDLASGEVSQHGDLHRGPYETPTSTANLGAAPAGCRRGYGCGSRRNRRRGGASLRSRACRGRRADESYRHGSCGNLRSGHLDLSGFPIGLALPAPCAAGAIRPLPWPRAATEPAACARRAAGNRLPALVAASGSAPVTPAPPTAIEVLQAIFYHRRAAPFREEAAC